MVNLVLTLLLISVYVIYLLYAGIVATVKALRTAHALKDLNQKLAHLASYTVCISSTDTILIIRTVRNGWVLLNLLNGHFPAWVIRESFLL